MVYEDEIDLLVTGARFGRMDVHDKLDAWLAELLASVRPPKKIRMRHGAARGVDTQAGLWGARHPGLIEVLPIPVEDDDWEDPALGLYAGNLRNQVVVDLCKPGSPCLAFPVPGCRGTWDCVRRARKRGLVVTVYPWVRAA